MYQTIGLLAASSKWEWLLGKDNWQLWLALGLFVGLGLIGIVLQLAKCDKVKLFAKVASVIYVLTMLSALIANLAINMGDDKLQKFQVFFIVMTALILVYFLVAIVIPKKVYANKNLKIVIKVIKIALLVSALVMGILALVNVQSMGAVDSGEIFAKLGKAGQVIITICTFGVLVAMSVFAMRPDKQKSNNTLAIVYGAVCIALSFSLSYVKFLTLPAGGSITLASLVPLALYSYIFGAKKGVQAGLIYGLLQLVQDPWVLHPAQILLDYPLAFGMFGLVGLFRKIPNKALGFGVGLAVCATLRYFCHVLSGGLFFHLWMASGYNLSAFGWSFLYNTFVFADMIVAVIVGCLLLSSKQFAGVIRNVEYRFLNK